MNKMFLAAILSLFSLTVYGEARSGIPKKVMLVNSTEVPTLWIYIDVDNNASCASDGIIKLGVNEIYSGDEIKMWSSLALTAFTAGKKLRVWYSNSAIESGSCDITNMSIEH